MNITDGVAMGTHLGPTLDNVPYISDRWCSDGLHFGSYAQPTCQYEQIDGAAMGSPLGPTRANVSL